MNKKFNVKGLVFLIFYAFSAYFFLLGIWVLLHTQSQYRYGRAWEDYTISMIVAILSNPKVWNFIKNNLYK